MFLLCNVEDWNTTVCLYSVSESSLSTAGAADRGGAARHGTTPDGLEVPSRYGLEVPSRTGGWPGF